MKTYERTFGTTAERDAWLAEARRPGGLMAEARAMQAPGCHRLRGRREAGVCMDTVTLVLANADEPPKGFALVAS